MSIFKQLLTAYFGLHGLDRVRYHLICRYWGRVSPRLREEHTRLLQVAEEGMKKVFQEALQSRGFLLEKVKHEAWTGGTLVVPFNTGDK